MDTEPAERTETIAFRGCSVLTAIQNMDEDASAASNIALLNKINGASVLSLRISESTTRVARIFDSAFRRFYIYYLNR